MLIYKYIYILYYYDNSDIKQVKFISQNARYVSLTEACYSFSNCVEVFVICVGEVTSDIQFCHLIYYVDRK
jgi:hypothetical protein